MNVSRRPKQRVAIIGDSTSFWIRPNSTQAQTYPEILRGRNSLMVELYLRPGNTFPMAVKDFFFKIAPKRYDLYIIALGINDICPRTVTANFARHQSPSFPANSWFEQARKFTYRSLTNNIVQRNLARLRISRPWSYLPEINSLISYIENTIFKEKNSKIIYLTIPKTSDRVEFVFPDIQDSIKKFNAMLITNSKSKKNVDVLDIYQLFYENELVFVPEGIHFSKVGHELIASKLLTMMEVNT